MSVDKAAISRTVLELEKSFNERWSAGDNRGYLDNYADEITYFGARLDSDFRRRMPNHGRSAT